MYIIKLKVTQSALTNFSFIDFNSLEKTINIIINQLFDNDKQKKYTIKIHYNEKCNQYLFGKGIICMSSFSDVKYPESNFIKTFLHEFKHWIQDKIYKISYSKNYIDYDINAAKYYKCPIEKDSRYFANNIWLVVKSLYLKIKKTQEKINIISTNPTKFYV